MNARFRAANRCLFFVSLTPCKRSPDENHSVAILLPQMPSLFEANRTKRERPSDDGVIVVHHFSGASTSTYGPEESWPVCVCGARRWDAHGRPELGKRKQSQM